MATTFQGRGAMARVDGRQKEECLFSLHWCRDLIADAVLPALPADKSFDELEKLLVEQVQPRKLAIAARYEFNQLKQGSDSLANFIQKLRNAAEDCSFSAQLEDRIHDQFVFSIANIHALKAMLIMKIEHLTLEKAINVAVSQETS